MRKPRRMAQIVTVVAVGVLALSGCSAGTATTSSTSSDEKGTIGFFTISSQIPVITAISDKVTEYFEADGYTVKIYDANFDPSQQAQQISEAANTGSIKTAWIFPVSLEALAPSLDLLQSQEVPAVIHASPEDFGYDGAQPGVIFLESDFANFGKTVGEEAATCTAAENGHEALFLQSVETSLSSAEIIKSVEATFADEAPGVPIVDTTQAADIATAQTNVSQLLIAHPDADIVITSTDETALGALAAYQAAGKTPSCVVAGGGGPDAIAAQKAGDIDALIAWDAPSAVSDIGVDVQRLIDDPTGDGALFDTPISVIK